MITGPCLLNLMPKNQMLDPKKSNRILGPLCCGELVRLVSSSRPLPAVYHTYGKHFVGTAHLWNWSAGQKQKGAFCAPP